MENSIIDNRGIVHRAYDQVSKQIKTDFLIDCNGCAGVLDDHGIYEPKPLWIVLRSAYWSDRKGIELFEGDIISYLEWESYNYSKELDVTNSGTKLSYAYIEWNKIHSKLGINRSSPFHINLEMVNYEGNVFENPELLELCLINL